MILRRLLLGLLAAAGICAAHAASLPPYVPPAALQDVGAASSCPFVIGLSGQSVNVGQDHNGPHNVGANVYVANSVQSPTGFVPASYTAAPFNVGVGGTVTDPALAYVNPGMAAAYYLRQSGLIPANRPIVILHNAVGAQSISDWVDGTPTDLWAPLVAQLTLLNTGATASDGKVLTTAGTQCPINLQTWNQGQADQTGAYGTKAAYLAAFDRLVAKFQALSNWSPLTRMAIAEMGKFAQATGSARNDAFSAMVSGCRYPFATIVSSDGMTVSTDNPTVHPDGTSEDLFGLRYVAAYRAALVGGGYSCPPGNPPVEVSTAATSYIASESEFRFGSPSYYLTGTGQSIQLPNAAVLTGQRPTLFSVNTATLTSAGTLYCENKSGTQSSCTLSAGVTYEAIPRDGTSWSIQATTVRTGQFKRFTAGAPYTGAQSFNQSQLAGVDYTLGNGSTAATVTLTANFGIDAIFTAQGSVASTIALASNTYEDGSTSITLQPGQSVWLRGRISSSASLVVGVTYLGGTDGQIIPKLAAAPTVAPGAGRGALFLLAGTNANTCKLVVQAGTSTTGATVVDNIPGC